ncbi:MAG: hypothetical protein P4K93_07600 [Terracidiphilus sp.]|nr:hypothetical protein [Terracidiphilus sp.]
MDNSIRKITPGQMKRLQVLYGQLARHTQEGADRASRMAWASKLLLRPIMSFKDLSDHDARHLIDTIQGQLGVKVPARPRKRLDRDTAQKAGTEGRRGYQSNETTLAGPSEFARIRYVLDLIGWSQAQFEGWLRSSRSPLSNRTNPVIRTLYEANRVYWALKGMATAQGKWKGRKA